MINIYRKGLGIQKLKIYSNRTGSEFYLEMNSIFEKRGFSPQCTFRSSMSSGKEILMNIQYKVPSFFFSTQSYYEGAVFLDSKSIGRIMISNNDNCYVNISLASGSKISLCGRTKEKSCRHAFIYHKNFSVITKYNGNEVIEMVDPGANRDMLFGIKLFGLNKIGAVSSDILEIEEKDIIFQTIPLFHFIIYNEYIYINQSPI